MTAVPGTSRRLVLADGRALHHRTAGSGSPTVVLEAGMGCSLAGWAGVVPTVAAQTATVAYDRAGYGQSDPDGQPRTLARSSADLIALLEHLDDDRFILVGHSWGGPIIRTALAARPDLVAGLVLVDPSDEDMELFHTAAAQRQRRWMAKALPAMRRLGLLRLGVKASTKGLPPAVVAEMQFSDTTASHVAAMQSELAAFETDVDHLRAHPLPLPEAPVTIITGVKETKKLMPGTGDTARNAVLAANERRAACYPHGRHVSAFDSTHYVPFTEPELVATEALALVDAVRSAP
jgi:pimeloyl-ACP methyl ester carboxylesterase